MKDIRQGTVLKPAKERELGSQRNSDSGAGTDALADALRRALAARGAVLMGGGLLGGGGARAAPGTVTGTAGGGCLAGGSGGAVLWLPFWIERFDFG